MVPTFKIFGLRLLHYEKKRTMSTTKVSGKVFPTSLVFDDTSPAGGSCFVELVCGCCCCIFRNNSRKLPSLANLLLTASSSESESSSSLDSMFRLVVSLGGTCFNLLIFNSIHISGPGWKTNWANRRNIDNFFLFSIYTTTTNGHYFDTNRSVVFSLTCVSSYRIRIYSKCYHQSLDPEMDSDCELMEVDYVEDLTARFSTKRLNFGLFLRCQTANLILFVFAEQTYEQQPETFPELNSTQISSTRRVLKAKRSLKSTTTAVSIVLDTNVLIEDLSSIKQIIASKRNQTSTMTKTGDRNKSSLFIGEIVVPLIVIQELDGLKNDRAKRGVTRAIHFINEQLKQNGLLRGDAALCSSDSQIEQFCNDDKIVNCCLNLLRRNESNVPSSSHCDSSTQCVPRVVLLTNDINLQNKALVHQIECFTAEEFLKTHLSAKSQQQKFPNKTHTKQKESYSKRDVADKSAPRLKRLKGDICSKKLVSQLRKDLSSLKKDKREEPVKSGRCSDLSVKYHLETRLIEFITTKLKQTYGDSWEKIVPNYDHKSASLYESLRLISRNWIGLFSDSFQRNKQVLNLINEMMTLTRNTNGDTDLNSKSKQLLQFLDNPS